MEKKICSVEGCGTGHYARGLCPLHYQIWRRKNFDRICSIDGCDKGHCAFGYCDKHYQVFKRNGVPETDKSRRYGLGFLNEDGYMMVCIDGKAIREHRYVMEQHIGRKLTLKEHIHHKNEIKTDNRIENLLIVTNESHKEHHTKKWETEKPCSLCGIIKPLNKFNFRLNKASYKERKRFYDSWCVQCVVDRKREWRKKKKLVGN